MPVPVIESISEVETAILQFGVAILPKENEDWCDVYTNLELASKLEKTLNWPRMSGPNTNIVHFGVPWELEEVAGELHEII